MPSSTALVSLAERTGVLPVLTTCLGPRTELAGLKGRTWPTTSQSKSIRSAARCCLTPCGRECSRELFDVGRDHHGLDLVEGEASALGPFGEAPDGREVGEAGVPVPDVGSEELPEAPLGVLGGGEERRCCRVAGGRGRALGAFDWDQVGEHGSGVYADFGGT